MVTRTTKNVLRLRAVVIFVVAAAALLCLFFVQHLAPQQKKQGLTFSGEVSLDKDYTVRQTDTLIVEPGTRIKIGDNVRLIVDGKIIAKGTADNPIVFEASGDGVYWRGIKINGIDDPPDLDAYWPWIERGDDAKQQQFFDKIDAGNVFEHCIFRNLATETRKFERINKWKGSIEVYNTSLRVSHCKFEDVLYFCAVLSQRSYVVANDNVFDDATVHKGLNATDHVVGLFWNNTYVGHRTKNQRCADPVWTKQFVGLVADNSMDSAGDDGIDVASSRTVLFRNKITGVWDDGIDINNGFSYAIQNEISGVNENGILVSNEAEAVLVGDAIRSSPFGLTLRDGATAVANELDITKNGKGVQLFQNIPCAITDADFTRVKERLRSMTPEEIDEDEYIGGITSPEKLIELLDTFYSFDGKYWIFNKKDFEKVDEFDDIKKIFKLVDVLSLEYVTNEALESHPLREHLKNGLYLTGSTVKDNEDDVLVAHDYRMIIEGTQFTSEDTKDEILKKCKCEKGYTCPLVEKLNTAAVESNARRIIKKLNDLYNS